MFIVHVNVITRTITIVPILSVQDTLDDVLSSSAKKPGLKRMFVIVITGISMIPGAILVILGAALLAKYNLFVDFVTSRHTETGLFLLAVGISVVVISGLGQYAILSSHYCLMITFLMIMIAVVVLEMIAGVIYFSLKNYSTFEWNSRQMLEETLARYCTLSYHSIPYHTTPYHTIPYHTVSYFTIPYRILLYLTYRTVPCLTLPYLTIPYCILLYCALTCLPYPTITLPYHTLL